MFGAFCRGVLIVALLAGPVVAKPLARVLKDTGLTPGDFEQVLAAEQTLIARGQVGRTISWRNAKSGAKGASTLAAQQGNCLYLQHFITLSEGNPRQEFRTAFCRQPDGQWLRAVT